ncbi:MAG: GAF domain-containing protein [Thermoanaerobaculia bacterium]
MKRISAQVSPVSETEQMRRRIVELENENVRLAEQAGRLETKLSSLRQLSDRDLRAYDDLERQLSFMEGENRRISEKFMETGFLNTHLTSLYAATQCLNESVAHQDVLEVIQEIVVNLIGSRELAIYELDPETSALELTYCRGIEPDVLGTVTLGEGVLGRVAADGDAYISGFGDTSQKRPQEALLSAAIPLKLDGKVVGVVAVFRLLPQKAGVFDSLDFELFELLADQAGPSLFRGTELTRLGGRKYLH